MTNWRTSIFGTLTLLAAFFTQFPDLLESILDPALAKKIAAGCALVTGFLTFANSKDRQVSGNGTFAAPTIVNDGSGKGVFPILVACGLALGTTACSSLDSYDRTYGVQYQDATGRHVAGTVKLAPRDGLAK